MTSNAHQLILDEYDRKRGLYTDLGLKMQDILEDLLDHEDINCLRPVARRTKSRESLERKHARGSGIHYSRLEDVTDLTG